MISIDNLSLSFSGEYLLKDISLVINPKDKIGLAGKNGAGKTTLLKIIVGFQQTDKGKVVIPPEITIGYLPQQMTHKDTRSVIDETSTAFSEVMAIQKSIDDINTELECITDFESDNYEKLLNKLTEYSERYNLLGGNSMMADLEQTLMGLGFTRSDFNRQTSEFSGGWRMRIELAKILLQKPKVLLLDEPTNHLDIESIQWFEEYLKNFPGAVMLVSHDRDFLDNITKRTIEISLCKIYDYKVSYTQYLTLRKERREQQIASYLNQKKMIDDTERFIERFRYKATKAVQVQSRIKQLAKVERIEVDEEDTSSIKIKFPPAPHSGKIVVECQNIKKNYGNNLVLDDIDLTIEKGETIAFVGKNGEGKSTLSKIIMQEIDYNGICKIGHKVNIGYFAQNQAQLLDNNKTVYQTLDDVAVGDIRTKIRDILGAFLFSGDQIDKKVKVLSGGERSRLAIAELLLQPYNLLVLDEPTNHLDIRSKGILKQALLQYDGTLILTSHDRHFLDGLVDKVYEFGNKKIKEHLGGIYDYLEKKRIIDLEEIEKSSKQNTKSKSSDSSDNKIKYEEKKEYEKKIRKINTQISASEKKISILEEEINKVELLLSKPETISSSSDKNAPYIKYQKLKDELAREMKKWENFINTLSASTSDTYIYDK
ncbi:ABC-F family ATP-binding cassette domain-containing protein [Bacteroidota bacterium]